MNWYKAITINPENGTEDSFIVMGSSLFNAYRNAIDTHSKTKAKTNTKRFIAKVIPAPHLDEYFKNQQSAKL